MRLHEESADDYCSRCAQGDWEYVKQSHLCCGTYAPTIRNAVYAIKKAFSFEVFVG